MNKKLIAKELVRVAKFLQDDARNELQSQMLSEGTVG